MNRPRKESSFGYPNSAPTPDYLSGSYGPMNDMNGRPFSSPIYVPTDDPYENHDIRKILSIIFLFTNQNIHMVHRFTIKSGHSVKT